MNKKTLGILGVIAVVLLIGLYATGNFGKLADDQVAAGGKGKGNNTTTYQCNDTMDNDSDGLFDYPADPGCQSTNDTSEVNTTSVEYPDANMQVSVNTSQCGTNVINFQEPTGGVSYTVAWKKPADTNWMMYGSSVQNPPITLLLGSSQVGASTYYEAQIYVTYQGGYGKSTMFNFTSAALCPNGGSTKGN